MDIERDTVSFLWVCCVLKWKLNGQNHLSTNFLFLKKLLKNPSQFPSGGYSQRLICIRKTVDLVEYGNKIYRGGFVSGALRSKSIAEDGIDTEGQFRPIRCGSGSVGWRWGPDKIQRPVPEFQPRPIGVQLPVIQVKHIGPGRRGQRMSRHGCSRTTTGLLSRTVASFSPASTCTVYTERTNRRICWRQVSHFSSRWEGDMWRPARYSTLGLGDKNKISQPLVVPPVRISLDRAQNSQISCNTTRPLYPQQQSNKMPIDS